MARKRIMRIDNAELLNLPDAPEMVTIEPRITLRADAFRALVEAARINRRSIEDEIAIAVELAGVALIPPPPKEPIKRGRLDEMIPPEGTLLNGEPVQIDRALWTQFVNEDRTIVIASTASGYRHVYAYGKKFRYRYNSAGQPAWFGPYDTAEEAAYARAMLIHKDFLYRAEVMQNAFTQAELPPDPNPPDGPGMKNPWESSRAWPPPPRKH